MSGRGAFRPGFAENSLANILFGFAERRKRVSIRLPFHTYRKLTTIVTFNWFVQLIVIS